MVGSGAPWLLRLRSFELKELSIGCESLEGPATELRAVEGLWTGLRLPVALLPVCVLTEVRGLNVTVRAGRRFGRDVD